MLNEIIKRLVENYYLELEKKIKKILTNHGISLEDTEKIKNCPLVYMGNEFIGIKIDGKLYTE